MLIYFKGGDTMKKNYNGFNKFAKKISLILSVVFIFSMYSGGIEANADSVLIPNGQAPASTKTLIEGNAAQNNKAINENKVVAKNDESVNQLKNSEGINTAANSNVNVALNNDESAYDEVRAYIEKYYVGDVSQYVLDAPTIDEMLKRLNDPYTTYFSKESFNEFTNSINNSFCGIGVYIEIVSEGVKVTSVMETSPAQKVGIEAEDIIVKAGGISLKGMTSEQAVSYIKGEEGSTVALTVLRGDKYMDFIATRAVISEPTVTSKMLKNNTAYIRIVSFGEGTGELFGKKLNEIDLQKPSSYIIDLRNNGGGYTTEAYDIAGYFIGSNPVVIMEDKAGNKITYEALEHDKVIDKPTYFLVDKYTASASEILSAAVKDNKKAYFIGEKTYGKGVAQSLINLSDGGELKLTTQRFVSPLGNIIQKTGITPDFNNIDSDALATAQLLSNNSGSNSDKSGYMKVSISGKEYEIDSKFLFENQKQDGKNFIPMEEYIKAFYDILNKADNGQVYVGGINGYTSYSKNSIDDILNFVFKEYEKKPELKNIPIDKKFTIKFNRDIDEDSAKEGIILFDKESGKNLEFTIDKVDGNTFTVKPVDNLLNSHEYYLIINDNVKTANGVLLKKGTIVKATTN